MEENNKKSIENIDEINEFEETKENKIISFFNRIKTFFGKIFKTNKQLALAEGCTNEKDINENIIEFIEKEDSKRSQFVASIKVEEFEEIRDYEETNGNNDISFDIEIATKDENINENEKLQDEEIEIY